MRRGRFTPRSAADKLPAGDVVKMQAAVSGAGKIMPGAVGDSIMAGATAGGSAYTQMIRRSNMEPAAAARNFAVAGKRTDEIASQIPAALAAGCNCIVINGLANDIQQGVAAATRRANMAANIQAILAGGARPVVHGLGPKNTPADVPAHVSDEVWLSLWCMKNGVQKIDAFRAFATAAGAFASGMNYDALHPSALGGITLSAEMQTAVEAPGKRTSRPLLAMTDTGSDMGSWINNAVSFTDTNADGIPDGWFSAGSGGTYSIQNADASGPGKWFRCAMTAGSNVGFNPTAATLASLGWAIGDTIAIGFRARLSAATVSLTANITSVGVSGNQALYQEPGANDIYAYAELVITSGTVINISFIGSGTGYFEVNLPGVFNLTKAGLA